MSQSFLVAAAERVSGAGTGAAPAASSLFFTKGDASLRDSVMPPAEKAAKRNKPPSLIPEQKEPKTRARDHDSAAEAATSAHGAPLEPAPAMPPTEQATERAAQVKRLAALPEHLRLGVTLAGMRELLKQMPSGAVEQVNAKIPREEGKRVLRTGHPVRTSLPVVARGSGTTHPHST